MGRYPRDSLCLQPAFRFLEHGLTVVLSSLRRRNEHAPDEAAGVVVVREAEATHGDRPFLYFNQDDVFSSRNDDFGEPLDLIGFGAGLGYGQGFTESIGIGRERFEANDPIDGMILRREIADHDFTASSPGRILDERAGEPADEVPDDVPGVTEMVADEEQAEEEETEDDGKDDPSLEVDAVVGGLLGAHGEKVKGKRGKVKEFSRDDAVVATGRQGKGLTRRHGGGQRLE